MRTGKRPPSDEEDAEPPAKKSTGAAASGQAPQLAPGAPELVGAAASRKAAQRVPETPVPAASSKGEAASGQAPAAAGLEASPAKARETDEDPETPLKRVYVKAASPVSQGASPAHRQATGDSDDVQTAARPLQQ